MPPPYLHPRSRMTSSLFATTVFASFFVVVLPHILPCPAPRVALADGEMMPAGVAADGTPRRRRRRRTQEDLLSEPAPGTADGAAAPAQVLSDANGMARFVLVNSEATSSPDPRDAAERVTFSSSPRRSMRECPVPKPGGIVGELLGFKSSNQGSEPPRRPQESPSPT
ncbi:hypothetical protein SEPCBS57363_004880 [Sporothrix epigloea]|uniref:Alpha-1,3-mannosyltransferase n=1 Tax=Sporothrix epigloea TaxID=1892477 RepID=A0ABP0DUS3_9PEZI